MPNTFIENRDSWMRMSEIDYLGQFVKTWLAFNAWYRSAYSESRDRAIIDEFKWQANPVLSKLRPLLETESDEAEQFRAEIGLLHYRLEAYELHAGKGSGKERISLAQVFLKDKPPAVRSRIAQGCEFRVELLANKNIVVRVTRRQGSRILLQDQHKFDPAILESLPAFQQLTVARQGYLRQLYLESSPRQIENLLTYKDNDPNTRLIRCGAFSFPCGRDALFAGVSEVLYLMRCTLFHGELAPTKDVTSCYEPAYRLVRRYVDCISA